MAEEITLEQQRKLEEAFKSFDDTKPLSGDLGTRGLSSKEDLCRIWPEIRGALLFLKSLPMVPKSVKDAVDLVIQAGDLVTRIVC